METPSRQFHLTQKQKYTPEEKQQLLANLDLEVAHRTRHFEATLADILENFKNHHEGQVLRVPRLVRGITMAEFGDKWNGDINECLKGLQRERHGGEPTPIDPALRKRKWQASQEGPGPEEAESSRAAKNARVIPLPKTLPSPATARKQRLTKTPLASRGTFGRPPPASPSSAKGRSTNPLRLHPPASLSFIPPSKTFNPNLPKAPPYPRPLRKDESLMSANGSPLANPFQYGFRFVGTLNGEGTADDEAPPIRDKRSNSGIIVRRDPSFNTSRSRSRELSRDGWNSRESSQSIPRPPSPTRPEPSNRPHSKSSSSSSNTLTEPVAPPQLSAMVRVPTRDGHVLEFDPLSTTPEEIDALHEISNSAKEQAKYDITRLVQAALARWKL